MKNKKDLENWKGSTPLAILITGCILYITTRKNTAYLYSIISWLICCGGSAFCIQRLRHWITEKKKFRITAIVICILILVAISIDMMFRITERI